MNILAILISCCCIAVSLLLVRHFILKKRQTKRKEQNYFIYMFLVYIGIDLFEIGLYVINVNETTFDALAIAWFFLIVAGLFAAGLTLMLKFTLANIALVIGWAVVGLYVYSLQIEGTNISLFNLIMVVINGFAMIFLAVLGLTLLYYSWETRLSPILGLLCAVGILALYSVGNFFGYQWPFPRNVARLAMMIVIYLGIKNKFGFWEMNPKNNLCLRTSIHQMEKNFLNLGFCEINEQAFCNEQHGNHFK